MQRTLKFRIWDGGRKKMFYKLQIGNTWDKGFLYTAHSIYIENKDENPDELRSGWYHIDESLGRDFIMQFTGMYDVNGKEIYEGDIVDVPHQGLFVVSYNCEKGMSAGWYLQIGDFERWTTMEARHNEDGDNYKVVGNIYENKDFVK